ncbi:MAG: alpha/beta fold hydrolase [Leptolyngbyaceae cyanobacterium bins.349]|nr:alpha/beta fold hydrolase [Leptolyngbyaceae cyanobacterium bins.349]
MKITKQNRLWLGLGSVAVVGVCLYASSKLVRRYMATLPRSNADHYLQVDNLKRAYDLYVPSSYNGDRPVPLVLALHGVGGDGSTMEQQTGFNQLAERDGFIVVYPDAVNRHWHSRRNSQPDPHNDIGFIATLIDDLSQRYSIDRRRIYATGFSNGGIMTHRLACELSDKVSAIAVVSAAIPEFVSRNCQSNQPISVLLIHGTKDDAIAYATPGGGLRSVPDTLKHWSDHNRCTSPIVQPSSAKTANVKVQTYKSCAKQTQVTLHSIQGGGHEWPRADSKTTNATTPTHSFDASTVIWDFFQQSPNQPSSIQ